MSLLCNGLAGMTSLTTLCSHFLLSYGNQAMTQSPTDGHGHVICMGNMGEVFSHENTPEGHTETHKRSFFSNKQVSGRMVIMNDLE